METPSFFARLRSLFFASRRPKWKTPLREGEATRLPDGGRGIVRNVTPSGWAILSLPDDAPGANANFWIVRPDGSPFEYDGGARFDLALIQHGAILALLPRSVPNSIIIEPDGRLFSFEGRETFLGLRRHRDGSTYVEIKKLKTRASGHFEERPAVVLVERDGDAFTHQEQSVFGWAKREDDGSTTLRFVGGGSVVVPR